MATQTALIAIGAYLRELRVRQQRSRANVADALGIAERTLLNWEHGCGADIKLLMLHALLEELGGTWADVEGVLTSVGAPAGDGLPHGSNESVVWEERHRGYTSGPME